MQHPPPIATTRLRTAQRLLTVFVAVLGLMVGTTTVASATSLLKPPSLSGVASVSVLETSVGVAGIPAPLFVAQQSSVLPGQVGQTCPRFDGTMVGSCVATNTGGEKAGSESPTVGEVLKGKKGSITNAPLPEGSPSWDDVRGKTMDEIEKAAKAGTPGYKTIKKLLTDKRFNK